MVVKEGLTISGKSMREHLEAINHQEGIRFIKDLQQKNNSFNERDLLSIHNLVLRGINPEDAGRYRKTQIPKNENFNMVSEPLMIPKEIEEYFFWYETNKSKLHPIILAAEMHFRLLKINPFSDGNGITSRLVMNLILLQKGYLTVNIKGDGLNKKQYSELTENNDSEDFIHFIAQTEKETLKQYIN